LDLNLRRKLVKCYVWSMAFLWCWNLDSSGSRSETPGNLWNVVMEKDWKDQLDRSCEKWRRVTYSQWAKEYPTWNKKTKS
jgi:hypothetical protein